jgi:hypothetical protein
MSIRKPPRLANWLLGRSGFAHQNPPLAGDLLEEFSNGRSGAWYWRQTLVVIVTGLVRSARHRDRALAGAVIAWAVDATITFSLLQLRYQHPHLCPPYVSLIGLIALGPLGELSRRAGKAVRPRYADPKSWAAYACDQLIKRAPLHCAFFLFLPIELPVFFALQAGWLLSEVKGALSPSDNSRWSPPRSRPDPS